MCCFYDATLHTAHGFAGMLLALSLSALMFPWWETIQNSCGSTNSLFTSLSVVLRLRWSSFIVTHKQKLWSLDYHSVYFKVSVHCSLLLFLLSSQDQFKYSLKGSERAWGFKHLQHKCPSPQICWLVKPPFCGLATYFNSKAVDYCHRVVYSEQIFS